MDPIQFLSNIGRTFNGLTATRKMSLIVAALLTLAGIWGVVTVSNRAEYRVLFANLSAEDAGSIVDKLREQKVPFEINKAGDAVSVPDDKVAELRLEMATAGLPRGGGVGFEIFDQKMKFGATEFEQQLNYRRALQGELARTIGSMEEVQHVRVHIALPKDSLFVEEQRKTTASVTMKLKSGRTLRPPQIEGIAHLVASSVEGLSPENVIIIDNRGAILSKPTGDPKFMRVTASQMEYQQNLERDLAGRIQSMLENVVGQGKAVVRVAADLDFRVTEKMEETYDSEAPVIRSMQKQTEKSGISDGGKGAVSTATPGTPEREKMNEVINYEINKVVNKTVMPIGETRKLSIAVLVDGIYQKDKQGKEVYQPRDKKEIDGLEDLVRKSIGFNAARGDQVAVSNMPFKKLPDEELVDSTPWWEKVIVFAPMMKYVGTVVILILVLLFVVRPAVRGLVAGLGQRARGSSAAPQLSPGNAEHRGELSPLAMMEGDPKVLTDGEMARQLAMADSKKFAELLRNWIK
jgi:flagellar M-ring protein FliF